MSTRSRKGPSAPKKDGTPPPGRAASEADKPSFSGGMQPVRTMVGANNIGGEDPTEVIKWFACGGGIAEAGPFDSQVEAWEAMRLAPPTLPYRERMASIAKGKAPRLPAARKHPPDTQVWPERVKIKPPKKEKKS